MRLLHTGDWHLGASTGGVSRTPDFERFFEWLREVVATRAVDVLVVAGDVFEHAQPSAEALALYYDALDRLVGSGLRAVVVVGGNHDSAARLDAPRDLLARLAVHVVGGLPAGILEAGPDALARALVRIDDLVVLAVPYLHEYRLGVRQSAADANANTIRDALALAFRILYMKLVELARSRWPTARLVATGHLVAAGARPGDWGAHIHQVGVIGALPADVFDPRLAYVALGHLHRSFEVTGPERGGPPTWYCGSPVALTLEEARSLRQVLLVDLPPGEPARVQPLVVPTFRELVALEGTPEDLVAALGSVRSSAPLPPLVHVRAHVEGWVPNLDKALGAALEAAGVGARIAGLRQIGPDDGDADPDLAGLPRVPALLSDHDPEAVFLHLAETRGEPVDDVLLEAFRGLVR
ncbi:MAG: exonuclease subunit SbcD [Deltaproteobacteria bacterium]|nr:exonuclease subunit SbcD [Deltaproteobacteria bacterium]